MHLRVPIFKMSTRIILFEKHLYVSKGNRYLRQSDCSFSFSVPCVREIEKVKSEKVKTKPKYRNVTRFNKLLRSAPQSSLKLVCEGSLRNNEISTSFYSYPYHGLKSVPIHIKCIESDELFIM